MDVARDSSRTFGITQNLGIIYHPDAQSAVERPHREYKMIGRSYMHEAKDWDRFVPIFKWSIRMSAKISKVWFSPYEDITGMKPRLLMDSVLGALALETQVPHTEYVKHLVEYLKRVHTHVAEQHHALRRDEQEQQFRHHGCVTMSRLGDYCILQSTSLTRDTLKDRNRWYQVCNNDECEYDLALGQDPNPLTFPTRKKCDICGRTPGRRIECPQCKRNVGPGCCWIENKDSCSICATPEPEPEPERPPSSWFFHPDVATQGEPSLVSLAMIPLAFGRMAGTVVLLSLSVPRVASGEPDSMAVSVVRCVSDAEVNSHIWIYGMSLSLLMNLVALVWWLWKALDNERQRQQLELWRQLAVAKLEKLTVVELRDEAQRVGYVMDSSRITKAILTTMIVAKGGDEYVSRITGHRSRPTRQRASTCASR